MAFKGPVSAATKSAATQPAVTWAANENPTIACRGPAEILPWIFSSISKLKQ